MADTSKTAKIIKRWYHSPSHHLTVNVLLGASSPNPHQGLCPWTPLGDFRSQTP